ncbi:MAG: AAA family ATPase [Planctomycetota bacterium]
MSQMYEQVFNFNSRPFTTTPYVKHYFPAESIQKAVNSLRVCIDRASGPAIVIGPTGTGKTLLLVLLEDQYQSQYRVVNLTCARLDSRESLLQAILFELGLPINGLTENQMRFSLIEFLKPSDSCPNGVLLLIDEAHSLDVDLLDEIRLITNFVRNGQPRVRLVLAGSQKLEDKLNDTRLDSLNQRIGARCYLQNMTRHDTVNYIIRHVDRVGGDSDQLFDRDGLKLIHQLTEGCPRLVNQLCDHTLINLATRGGSKVETDCIQEAWSTIQSIPGLWMPSQPATTEKLEKDSDWTVLEFGQLDDDGDATGGTTYEFHSDNELESVETDSAQVSSHDDAVSESSESFSDSQETMDELQRAIANLEGVKVETGTDEDEATEASGAAAPDRQDSPRLTESLQADELNYPTSSVDAVASFDQDEKILTAETNFGAVAAVREVEETQVAVPPIEPALPSQYPASELTEHSSVQDFQTESLTTEFPTEQLAKANTENEESAVTSFGDNEYGNPEQAEAIPTEQHLVVETLSQDQVEETFGQSSNSNGMANNPFEEEFAEEEHLTDRFAPYVAYQNQSSLTLSSAELGLLKPVEAQAQSSEEIWQPQPNQTRPEPSGIESASESQVSEAPTAFLTNDSDEENVFSPLSELSSTEGEGGTETPSVFVIPSAGDEKSFTASAEPMEATVEASAAAEFEPDSTGIVERETRSNKQFHEHSAPTISSEIEKEAEEILQRLQLTSDLSELPTSELNGAPVSHETPDQTGDRQSYDNPEHALQQTQQILDEILEQKNILEQQQETFLAPTQEEIEASIQFQYGFGDAAGNDRQDDRHMIVVDQPGSQPNGEPLDDRNQEFPLPETPISTGNAERMDYKELFDQLRETGDSQS